MSKEFYILAFEKNEKEIFYVHRYTEQGNIYPTDEMLPLDQLLDESKEQKPRFFQTKPQAQLAIDDISYPSFRCKATGLSEEEVLPNIKPRPFILQ